jgi:4-hydroxy-2-oxoglutarate aldolase
LKKLMSDLEIRGLIPPIPTPFDEHEGLAPEKLWSNLERWNTGGFSGYVVLGSNGEFVHLTERERLNVLEVARDAIPPHLLFIAGCSLQSTAETIIYLKQATRLGANTALVNAPFYYKSAMTPARLLAHFHQVADESPIPILLYNVPQFTGVSIPLQTIAQLAEHPNIKGIKESAGDIGLLSNILRLTPETFRVLIGSASAFFPGLVLGAHGAVLAVSSVAWEVCLEIMNAIQSKEYQRARDLHLRLLPVAAAVTTQFDVGGLKAALELRGFYGGPPRSPLTPATEETVAEILRIFRASGLFPELES